MGGRPWTLNPLAPKPGVHRVDCAVDNTGGAAASLGACGWDADGWGRGVRV
jgi:hypothetical protein